MTDKLKEKFTRNIVVGKEIRDRYVEISKVGLLGNRDYRYPFLLCLALGYETGKRTPIKEAKTGLVNVDGMRPDDLWAIAAVAVKEQKKDKSGDELKILLDGAEMKKIANEYAHTGLPILEQLLNDFGSSGSDIQLEMENRIRKSLAKLKKST